MLNLTSQLLQPPPQLPPQSPTRLPPQPPPHPPPGLGRVSDSCERCSIAQLTLRCSFAASGCSLCRSSKGAACAGAARVQLVQEQQGCSLCRSSKGACNTCVCVCFQGVRWSSYWYTRVHTVRGVYRMSPNYNLINVINIYLLDK